jgi:hypothetical protein
MGSLALVKKKGEKPCLLGLQTERMWIMEGKAFLDFIISQAARNLILLSHNLDVAYFTKNTQATRVIGYEDIMFITWLGFGNDAERFLFRKFYD